jgi:hypothetical protein
MHTAVNRLLSEGAAALGRSLTALTALRMLNLQGKTLCSMLL